MGVIVHISQRKLKVSNTVPRYYLHAFNKTAGNRVSPPLCGSISNPPESQCRNAEQRLRAFVSIHDGPTNYLPFKLNLSGGYVQGDGLSVRKHVFAAALRFESDLFEVRPRHERVEHASIDEEFAGPASLRVRRIADGYVNVDCAHCGSPSELVLLLPCLK